MQLNKNKVFIIIIVCIVLIVLGAYICNYILYENAEEIDCFNAFEIKTNDKLFLEQDAINENKFSFTQINARKMLLYGLIKYGIKVSCYYNDGQTSFAYEIYEVRYEKTKIYNCDESIIGINKSIALKDLYIVIPNGNIEMLKKAFKDIGLSDKNFYYKTEEEEGWYLE